MGSLDLAEGCGLDMLDMSDMLCVSNCNHSRNCDCDCNRECIRNVAVTLRVTVAVIAYANLLLYPYP